MKIPVIILACSVVCLAMPVESTASWTNSWYKGWTNGTIWASRRFALDLRDAGRERMNAIGQSPALFETPTIWPTWRWLTNHDEVLRQNVTNFVNVDQYADHSYAAWFLESTDRADPPMWTWTGVCWSVGLTNGDFTHSGTNRTIWMHKKDFDERRLVYNKLVHTKKRGADWYGALQWVGDGYYYETNVYNSAAWTIAEGIAATNITIYDDDAYGDLACALSERELVYTRGGGVEANRRATYYTQTRRKASWAALMKECTNFGCRVQVYVCGTVSNESAGWIGMSWMAYDFAGDGTNQFLKTGSEAGGWAIYAVSNYHEWNGDDGLLPTGILDRVLYASETWVDRPAVVVTNWIGNTNFGAAIASAPEPHHESTNAFIHSFAVRGYMVADAPSEVMPPTLQSWTNYPEVVGIFKWNTTNGFRFFDAED